MELLIRKQRPLVACCYNNKQPTKTVPETKETLASPGSQRLSSCSSWCPQMKWWTDCRDQLFPGIKTPWVWVTQQCRSSTYPPIPCNFRHIDVLDLGRNGVGKKCTLRGGELADQTRPPIYRSLPKSANLAAKRTAKLVACCPVEKRLFTMQTRAAMHCRHTVKQVCIRRWCRS